MRDAIHKQVLCKTTSIPRCWINAFKESFKFLKLNFRKGIVMMEQTVGIILLRLKNKVTLQGQHWYHVTIPVYAIPT